MIPVLNFGNGVMHSAKLARVFSDACSHIAVAKMIQAHLTNKDDIRKLALQSLDLSQSKKILDVGCGFGYFTAGLAGRVHPEAEVHGVDIHAANKIHYLKACEKARIKGQFSSDGVTLINSMPDHSFDLIVSSFSLYFFPEQIKNLARLLKNEGHCVIITHAVPHMHELTKFVKEVFAIHGGDHSADLPYELLISKFSSENGAEKLAPWFASIQSAMCKSSLVFPDGDYDSLRKYFKFKHPFFLAEQGKKTDQLIDHLLGKVHAVMKQQGHFTITKDDMIFICSKPKQP